MHFGFNWGNSDNTVSKYIELLLEGRVDDVTKFLSGFGDDSFEEGKEMTSFVKFYRAEGGSGGFFVGGGENGDWPFTFELVVVMLFADLIEV